ncbi:MAG: anti-sigma factor antagonist [Actinomycetota bacterium]|jgi:anti-anti-sigma factor|nr:anti-sigma factor antagonist [Actinomycetota bacterium]
MAGSDPVEKMAQPVEVSDTSPGIDLTLHAAPNELLRWSVSIEAGAAVVFLDGELDISNVSALAEVLTALVDDGVPSIAIDVRRLGFVDSAGIRCFCNAWEAASEAGSRLVVRNPTPMIARTMKICGVDAILLESPASQTGEGR